MDTHFPWAGLLAVLLGGLIVWSGAEDARHRTIANAKNATIALAAPLWWWANGLSVWPDMAWQVALAAIVMVPLIGVFAMGWMGGGDVKMIAALALWLPVGAFAQMLVVMSILGGVLTLVMLADARLRRTGNNPEVPYGVAIAAATLIALPGTVS